MNLEQLRFAILSTQDVSDLDCTEMLNELEEDLDLETTRKILGWLRYPRPELHFTLLAEFEIALQHVGQDDDEMCICI